MHPLAPALTLTLALTLTFNHLADELLQATTMLYGLMYLTCGSATKHEYLIRCATDYKGDIDSLLHECISIQSRLNHSERHSQEDG